MKNTLLALIISVFFFIPLLSVPGCAQNSTQLAFEKGDQLYVIDTRSAGVSVFGPDGSLSSSMGSPAAGIDRNKNSKTLLPIIYHLILSKKKTIAGLVWYDLNGDLSPDGEQGAPGVRIFLDIDGDSTYSHGEPDSITDPDGMYEITRLHKNTYSVQVDDTTLPPGYVVITSHPLSIKLTGTQKKKTADFGIQNRSASVDGHVWNDSNADGSINNSEAPVPGVDVYVDINGDGEYTLGEPIATTDVNGFYSIQKIQKGAFNVHVDNNVNSLPVAFHRTPVTGTNPAPVTLADFQNNTVNFGYQLKSAISGVIRDTTGKSWPGVTLFIDLNGNGVYDVGEPMAITDANGFFIFNNLLPGDYTILLQPGQQSLTDYIIVLSPGTITLGEGEQHTVVFITQTKLGAVHSLTSPTRLSWGGDGKLYVSDNANGSVFIYDNSLNILGELKKLFTPLGVNADADGNIYIGVQSSKTVDVYDSSGDLLKSLGSGNIETPNDIAFDRSNNVYILDSSSDTILVYDQTGTLMHSIGDSNLLDYGVSIAVHYRDDGTGVEIGELYVADLRKSLIQVFSLQGTYLRSIGGPARTSPMNINTLTWEGLFAGLKAIDFDQNGILHALDSSLNVIEKFDPVTGAYLGYYDANTPENADKLNLQTDISINDQGQVVQLNFANKSVEQITTIP